METPTSTRDLVGDDRRDEPRPVDRDRHGDNDAAEASRVDDETRETTTRSGTAGFAERSETATDDSPELLPRDQNAEFQTRWEKIQTGFVDEPRQTVEQADELVAEVMKRLAEGFATERASRGPVGPRRGRLDRGPARDAAALPRLLPAPALSLSQ